MHVWHFQFVIQLSTCDNWVPSIFEGAKQGINFKYGETYDGILYKCWDVVH